MLFGNREEAAETLDSIVSLLSNKETPNGTKSISSNLYRVQSFGIKRGEVCGCCGDYAYPFSEGQGIVLTQSGLMLTPYHVIVDSLNVWMSLAEAGHDISNWAAVEELRLVKNPSGEFKPRYGVMQNSDYYPVDPSFCITDPSNDVALIKVQLPVEKKFTPPVLINRDLKKGEVMHLISEQNYKLSGEVIDPWTDPETFNPSLPYAFTTDIHGYHGLSGSAMVTEQGELAGYFVQAAPDYSYVYSPHISQAIPLLVLTAAYLNNNLIKNLFRSNGTSIDTGVLHSNNFSLFLESLRH